MPRVYVKTMGCKVNTYDGHALAHEFAAHGYTLAEHPDDAEITVVNTCSVTANADREARYLARKLRRDNPNTLLVYTGCYAQTDSARLAAMDEIDLVVPNEAKDRLVEAALAGASARAGRSEGQAPIDPAAKLPTGVRAVTENRQNHFKAATTYFDRADSAHNTRAFLKVQDGCDGFCAYCLIPYARGASRSVPPERVVAEAHRLMESGCPEIVLTGIHIGDYGRDLPQLAAERWPIAGLIDALCSKPFATRLRISSLEPGETSDALLASLSKHHERICDHFHLPLQSGSDRVLRAMRRTYDRAAYADAIKRIRAIFPEASIGADVIPGFPGETAEEHQETIDFVRELELSYLHVFPYSKRPNTAAARMPGHIAGDVVRARAAELRTVGDELKAQYGRRFLGHTRAVVWEKEKDIQGRAHGLTGNYLGVTAPRGYDPKPGLEEDCTLKGFVEDGRLLARPVAMPRSEAAVD